MTKNEVYSVWAPGDSPWSPWVKPVLFAHLNEEPESPFADQIAPDIGYVPSVTEKTAIIVDLPGADSALMGLALAGAGYRPVPLYNALPLPAGRPTMDELTNRPVAAVDVRPIMTFLWQGAERLTQLHLPAKSPPAFLLDANRGGGGRVMKPEEFDNRSISFTTDFPSAAFLASQGIKSFLLIQANRTVPPADLAHSL